MTEPCVIDGSRCTACCRAILLDFPLSFIKRQAKLEGSDSAFIAANWKRLTWRRAKKKNPFLVDVDGRTRRAFRGRRRPVRTWWHCRHVSADGCGVHGSRPAVCRDYPTYRNSPETMRKLQPEYHPACTEFPRDRRIPMVEAST